MLDCPKCGQLMQQQGSTGVYKCMICQIWTTVELHEGWPGGKKTTVMTTFLDPLTGEADCHCGHSWYDHIGWRMEKGEYKTSRCRIVRCGCDCYTAKTGYEGDW